MARIVIVGMVLVGLGAVGFVFLSSWQIPVPSTTINKVISNDDLTKQ